MISSSWSGHLGQNLQWIWRTRFRLYDLAFGVQGSAGHVLPFCRSFLGGGGGGGCRRACTDRHPCGRSRVWGNLQTLLETMHPQEFLGILPSKPLRSLRKR